MIPPTRPDTLPLASAAARPRPRLREARLARGRRARGPALCAAMLCVGSLWADAHTRTSRPPRAASTPSTAQILAPSAATVPDALPPDKLIYRCGNTYSAHACADAKPLDVADARSDAQRRQSQELTRRDQRMAAWLEAERHGRESVASAPRRTERATPVCVDKPGRHCKPREPSPRRIVTTTGASGPALANKR